MEGAGIGSEFQASLSLSGAGGEEAETLLCGANGGADADFGKNWTLLTTCHWRVLGTIAPTFVTASYVKQSKSPLNLFSLRATRSGSDLFQCARSCHEICK